MSEPFLAEIRIVGFNFAPRGWAFCDGQILPINQNQSLYSLLGTTYGGDGRTSFALPDLRGRVPIHVNSNHKLGQKSGEETHTLVIAEAPSHGHTLAASGSSANQSSPSGNLPAKASAALGTIYSTTDGELEATLNNSAVTSTGGQPHDNMQPFLALNYCIALRGLFPSRN